MIRLAILLLLLTACAHNPHSYSAGQGVIYDGRQYWIGNPSESEKDAWLTKHVLTPAFDDAERDALAWCSWGSAADIGTTAIGLLTCSAIREANPVLAWMPPHVAIPVNVAASWALCTYWRKQAEASPLAYSSAADPKRFGQIRAGLGVWNVGQIARCL